MATLPTHRSVFRSRAAQRRERRTLALGPARVSVSSNDPAADEWLAECLNPWFRAVPGAPGDWHVDISASEKDFTRLRDLAPPDAPSRVCFAFDQRALSLPAWTAADRVTLSDAERSCFLEVTPTEVRLVADPCTRRWRMTLLWLVLEIAATSLRRTRLDLHAASVEHAGKAVLIAGPKEAGKTTLSLHLLRSGLCRWIANDRVWIDGEPPIDVAGMPLPVRFRSSTVREFPELFRGISAVPRSYLYTADELARATSGGTPDESFDESTVVALSPAQLVRQMNVEPAQSAPLGAIVFPRIAAEVDGWTIERLDPAEVRAGVRANRYRLTSDPRHATVFETLAGGPATRPSEAVRSLGDFVPGYRLALGPNAYDRPDFGARLLEILGPS